MVDPKLEGFQTLIDEMGLEQEMVIDLAESFIDRGSEYITDLKFATRENDLDAMDRISHTMKGMVGNLRFSDLFMHIEQFRNHIKSEANHSWEGDLEKMEESFNIIRDTLKATWLNQP